MNRARAQFFLLPWVLAACGQTPRETGGAGQMEVRWEGSRDGRVSGPVSASWCEARRILEIRSIRGDTGVALVLYPRKSLAPGSYRVLEPARAESLPPAAGVAVRWLTQNVVQGFRGDSGQLELERSGTGRYAGRVHARARSVVDTQRIVLTGTFRDLVPGPDSLRCAPPDTTDQDVPPVDVD